MAKFSLEPFCKSWNVLMSPNTEWDNEDEIFLDMLRTNTNN